jgi:hypothetical protein
LERHYEREWKRLEEAHAAGHLTDAQYREEGHLLQREEGESFRDAYEADREDAIRDVEAGWW